MEEATQVDHKENKHQVPAAEQHVLDGEEALKSFQDEVARNHLDDSLGEEGAAYDEAAHGASVEVVEEDTRTLTLAHPQAFHEPTLPRPLLSRFQTEEHLHLRRTEWVKHGKRCVLHKFLLSRTAISVDVAQISSLQLVKAREEERA